MDDATAEALRSALKTYRDDDGNAAQAGLNLALEIASLLPEGDALVFGEEDDEP